jgi:4-hydroxybutyryl-CoA dehydratase/vinylacetyl-CoA-Delta-isomerase
MTRITTGEQYIESLRGRELRVFLWGQKLGEPVEHPLVRPSVNAVAETYDLALREPELASVISPVTGKRTNRFLHVAQSADELVMQGKMQRRMGQNTGTCFQRCVGMDALNAIHSVTFEIDEAHGTDYHQRFLTYLAQMQDQNLVIGGAMTDVKGDRSKPPHLQEDPDVHVHVVRRDKKGLYVRGAKAHQTGCINSHWLIIMPTVRLEPEAKDYAIIGAIPADAPGITYIYGRQSSDLRSMETGTIDDGNTMYAGQEALIIFDDVFIPWEHVFMDGEHEFAVMLVDRCSCYHRRSYVCKSGVGDVLIGAAATAAAFNGVPLASHIRDKLVEMNHLNETIYSAGIAASYQGFATRSGAYLPDTMLANVCKHHVTVMPFTISRIAQDLAGGLMVTMPSEADLLNPETGDLIRKYLTANPEVDAEDRMRIMRLIESMCLGRNAVNYLTESVHGAGSPQAQRIQMYRQMQLPYRMRLAKSLAGVEEGADPEVFNADDPIEAYFTRVFRAEGMRIDD